MKIPKDFVSSGLTESEGSKVAFLDLMEVLVISIIIFSLFSNTYQQMNGNGDRIVKIKGQDLNLKCLLSSNHENYNHNSLVTWWMEKICEFPKCLQSDKPDGKTAKILLCNACKLTITLNDMTADNAVYYCKISPYRVSSQRIFNLQFSKSFHVTIDGDDKQKRTQICKELN